MVMTRKTDVVPVGDYEWQYVVGALRAHLAPPQWKGMYTRALCGFEPHAGNSWDGWFGPDLISRALPKCKKCEHSSC